MQKDIIIIEDTKIDDEIAIYSNVVWAYQGKIVFVKWKGKTTWELPWGRLEKWESSFDCAKRELYEETGITNAQLQFLCSWTLHQHKEGKSHYWNVYLANVLELWELPESEIEEVELFTNIPENLTYPVNQIDIVKKAQEYLANKKEWI